MASLSQWGMSPQSNYAPQPPSWVRRMLGAGCRRCVIDTSDDFICESAESGELSLISVCVPNAVMLEALSFQRQTVRAYEAIRTVLDQSVAAHPVRFWNFIPHIGEPLGEALDRYMVFNAGRYSAYTAWYGGPETFSQMVATASGVGHFGTDLIIHCLAARTPGIAVENPRQVPSYGYSPRYGPLPPTFARATLVEGSIHDGGLILVGGTASICGESSRHWSDLQRQLGETLENVASVIQAASKKAEVACADWRTRVRSLRVYHTQPQQRRYLTAMMQDHFAQEVEIEWQHANLCRPELLVEIEGLAELQPVNVAGHGDVVVLHRDESKFDIPSSSLRSPSHRPGTLHSQQIAPSPDRQISQRTDEGTTACPAPTPATM